MCDARVCVHKGWVKVAIKNIFNVLRSFFHLSPQRAVSVLETRIKRHHHLHLCCYTQPHRCTHPFICVCSSRDCRHCTSLSWSYFYWILFRVRNPLFFLHPLVFFVVCSDYFVICVPATHFNCVLKQRVVVFDCTNTRTNHSQNEVSLLHSRPLSNYIERERLPLFFCSVYIGLFSRLIQSETIHNSEERRFILRFLV